MEKGLDDPLPKGFVVIFTKRVLKLNSRMYRRSTIKGLMEKQPGMR